MANGCFVDADQLLEECKRIAHLPCAIAPGRAIFSVSIFCQEIAQVVWACNHGVFIWAITLSACFGLQPDVFSSTDIHSDHKVEDNRV